MEAERSLFEILTLFAMVTTGLSAEVAAVGDVRAAMKNAGGNRSELETALHQVKGKDTEYLIAHTSQYDLVNLNAQQINPLFPASGPATRSFNGLHPKSKFLAVKFLAVKYGVNLRVPFTRFDPGNEN